MASTSILWLAEWVPSEGKLSAKVYIHRRPLIIPRPERGIPGAGSHSSVQHVQAEVLWTADSVGELTLGQALPLNNLSLMDYGVLGKLALSQGSAERGMYSLVCSAYH